MQTSATVLAQAARMGGYAPSIHNTQPWRWRVHDAVLELIADRSRQLDVTDPAGRLLTVSCGTALHHVRLALAAEGWSSTVDRVPDLEHDVLARITLGAPAPASPELAELVEAIRRRRSDRRPVPDEPVDPSTLESLAAVAEAEGASLHFLPPDGVIELASAAAHAQHVEAVDASWREELEYWVGRGGPVGVPAAAIPDRAPETTVPARDFGQAGSLPVGGGHDRFATYAILYGTEDTPVGWLRGGEALSAVWLAATGQGLRVLPMSAAVEVPGTRRTLRRLLSDLGYPYLALRIGRAEPGPAGPPATPRLPTEQVVEVVG